MKELKGLEVKYGEEVLTIVSDRFINGSFVCLMDNEGKLVYRPFNTLIVLEPKKLLSRLNVVDKLSKLNAVDKIKFSDWEVFTCDESPTSREYHFSQGNGTLSIIKVTEVFTYVYFNESNYLEKELFESMKEFFKLPKYFYE